SPICHNERYAEKDKVERVRLEQKDQQFLYENDGMLVFMDTDTYEQIELPSEILGERRPFLQDGMTIVVEFHEAEALNATLPQKVVCKIVETEPVVKGQTAANSFKPATLDNGLKVMVPPFVGQDEDIVVNTETMEYSERA
ncbi:MAG: elongation factor P, partial [Pseudomonadota bacterium]